MQILKDEVKNKIIDAAVEEFLVNGYTNSSMRTIAAQAGITIGNIYSYFSSKDNLFESVVSPAWEALNTLMSMEFPANNSKENLMNISNEVCSIFIANKERFLILMNNSQGSKFENTKENIIEFVGKRLNEENISKLSDSEIDPLLAKVFASALLYGFLTIFNHYGGDEERLTMLIHELLFVFMGNVSGKR